MPYLTASADTLRTAGGEQLGFGVPGYAHPLLAPAEWAELVRPGTPLHWAVLNIAGGPGTRPDPHCLEVAGRLRNARERALHGEEPDDSVRACGGRLLGHLDLAHGGRPFDELIADARSFIDWYRVGGFYLARCPTERAELPAVRRLTGTLHALLAESDSADDGGRLVLGHGTHPTPDTRRRPTNWSLSRARGPTTAGRRWPSGRRTIRRAGSRTSSTGCPAPISTRRCASPAGRAPGRSSSRTGADRAPTDGADKPIHSRRCPGTGTKSSRGSDPVSRNEKGRGSVTGRTTVRSRCTRSRCT